MIVTTAGAIPDREIGETLGVVMGSTVRARWFGRDIAAALKQIVGGEIKSYTDMMEAARKQALNRLKEEAAKLGADAVIAVRFTSTQIMTGAAEILAYGTAVRLKGGR
ncbi:MAG TPA: heavy metal-binding domain-containing protein [Desulfotomaculum sp.]|nr:heavy metal-binding domain-containing protein [Desulfotomaculum sp.]